MRIRVGRRTAMKTAGDLVSQANPRQKPAIMAISRRRCLNDKSEKTNVQIINMASSPSTRAIRSKNTEYGRIIHRKEAIRERRTFLNSRNEARPIPEAVNRPAMADRVRPATSGSEITLNTGMTAHIYKGCLPSERGRNLRVDTERIICAQRRYMDSSAKTGMDSRRI